MEFLYEQLDDFNIEVQQTLNNCCINNSLLKKNHRYK